MTVCWWHSSQSIQFDSKPCHLLFVVEQVALQWGLLAVLRFSHPSMIHISFTCHWISITLATDSAFKSRHFSLASKSASISPKALTHWFLQGEKQCVFCEVESACQKLFRYISNLKAFGGSQLLLYILFVLTNALSLPWRVRIRSPCYWRNGGMVPRLLNIGVG